MTAPPPARTPHLRRVTLTRDSLGHYTIRNDRGGQITTTASGDGLGPLEMALAAIAGCTAIDVDTVTSRRAEPEQFEVEVVAEKVKDEQGNHLRDIQVTFRVRFPEGEAGDAARAVYPRMVQRSHDEFCTVARTIMLGADVTSRAE